MPCNVCRSADGMGEYWIGPCPECEELRWYPGSGDRIFKVPGFIGGKPPLVPVDEERNSIIQDLRRPKRTRLISKYRYGAKARNEPEHIEYLLGLQKPSGKWTARLEAFRRHIAPMGLSLSQLVPDSEIIESEPLLLHWKGIDPFDTFPAIQQCPDPITTANARSDPNWGNYKLDLNMHPSIFDSEFREHQKKAIEQILESTGSRQIIALPTGYGKTRIVQTVTNILRNHSKGPTLMITPIIALRDDQREAFDKDFRDNFKIFNREFNGAFITPEENDVDEVIDDLINDRLDILCCAPEHLLNPSSSMSWIEIFQRMKRPFSTLVVDEAHVVGDWGSSFRSHFLLLGQLKSRMVEMEPDLRVILQSATITIEEEKELKNLFDGLGDLGTIRVSDTRADLHFRVELEEAKSFDPEKNKRKTIDFTTRTNEIWDYYDNMPGPWREPWLDEEDTGRSPLLIYSATKADAKDWIRPTLAELAGQSFVEIYDGDTPEGKKDSLRRKFKNNEFHAMLATSAFGMGIDKPDVWFISYLGLPWTLKGLYQGFGRAARGSNWKGENTRKMKNGNCIAILPDVDPNKARPFRPELRIELAAERLWDLLMSENSIHISERGYIISPVLDGLYEPLWMQRQKETIDYMRPREESEEEEDEEDDTTGWVAPEDEWKQAQRKFQMGRFQTARLNLTHKMWSLACLQRLGAVSILGFYPLELAKDERSGEISFLKPSLEDGGHERVVEKLKSVNPSLSILTPASQKRQAVIRFNQPMTSWRAVIQTLIDGHSALKERHKLGNKELSIFMQDVREGECLRKAFGPAIGAPRGTTLRCQTLLEEWRNNKKTQQGAPPVPCSNCIEKMEMNLSLDSPTAPLWIDESNMRILRDDPEPKPEPPNPLRSSWKNTGSPTMVFIPKSNDNDELNWIVPNPPPVIYYSDRGEPIPILTSKSGRYFIIEDPPLGSRAIVMFDSPLGSIGRFIDFRMVDELIEKWNDSGIRIVGL